MSRHDYAAGGAVDINESGSSIFSTKLTIDNTSKAWCRYLARRLQSALPSA